MLKTVSVAKRLLRVGLLAGVALVAAAVLAGSTVGGATASTAREGGTFRVAVPVTVFGAIDPALLSLPSQSDLLRPACGALMSYPHKPLPAGLSLEPELAESAPIVSRNGRTYTFTIRKDARFSNGAPVTARAFAHALERIFDPAMRSSYADNFQDIVGARKRLAGKATTLGGVVAKGRTLTIRLRRRVHDFPVQTSALCAVPASLPADPEGAKAPLPSAAPYYVLQYVPGQLVVLERNRFYRGPRTHHVDRITADLGGDLRAAVDEVASGTLDYVWPAPQFNEHVRELAERYRINRTRLFARPGLSLGEFILNTSRPLFRNNPKLRQAVNFAVDRTALVREIGPRAATPTDQYLLPAMPAYRNERIYPLKGPDLNRARALAQGHRRFGKAVLYTCTEPECVALAQIVQQNLKTIGLEVEINRFPRLLLFEKLQTPGEPFDMGRVFWNQVADPSFLNNRFDGRTNSYFNSPKYTRLLDSAARLSGPARSRAYGELDVQLSRDAAPGVPYALRNVFTFVSARVGCVVLNPGLDLTAVCLK